MAYHILYLAVMLVLLPVLAESIYSPTLPDLAASFAITGEYAGHTMSIYLLGASLGPLIWGNISDSYGRRPVVLCAYALFLLATAVCIFASEFKIFMFGRLLQGLAGAISCMSPCILRDVFSHEQRMEVSSTVGMVVSVAPAMGALLGGAIASTGNWRLTFVFLLVVGIIFYLRLSYALPETAKTKMPFKLHTFKKGFYSVFSDPNLLGHAMMIGLGLGICFAFFVEGPFYFTEKLNLSAQWFGLVCALGAAAYAIGCRLANHIIQSGVVYTTLMQWGLLLMLFSYTCFTVGVYTVEAFNLLAYHAYMLSILLTGFWILSQFALSFVLTPSFALALENQAESAGVAASWFSFIYNIMNMIISALMAYLHSESLQVMPVYFLLITLLMIIILWVALDKKWLHAHNVAECS